MLDLRTSRDGSRVLYREEFDAIGVSELRTAAVDGSSVPGTPYDALATLVVGGARDMVLTPDERTVVYAAEDLQSGQFRLLSQPVERSGQTRVLTPMLSADASVVRHELMADGVTVVYEIESSIVPNLGLFRVPIDGSALPLRLSPAKPVEQWCVIGANVYYSSRSATTSLFELNRVPWLAAPTSTRLTPVLPSFAAIDRFVVAPDESLVVYAGDAATDSTLDLFAIDTSTPNQHVQLTQFMGGSVGAHQFDLSPDATSVAYSSDVDQPFVFSTYAVATAGSAPPVRLHPDFGTNADMVDPAFTLDGQRVVFRGDPNAPFRYELLSTRFDGTDFRNLSAPANHFDDVLSFEVAAQGAVVYYAEQTAQERDVFRVPASGASAPESVVLLPTGNGARDFLLTPDRQRILYTSRYPGDLRYSLGSASVHSALATASLFQAPAPDVGLLPTLRDEVSFDGLGRAHFLVFGPNFAPTAYRVGTRGLRPAVATTGALPPLSEPTVPIPTSNGLLQVYTREVPGQNGRPIFVVDPKSEQIPI